MTHSAFAARALLAWVKGEPFPKPFEHLFLSLHGSQLDAEGADELTASLFGAPVRWFCSAGCWGDISGPDPDGGYAISNARDILLGRCTNPEPVAVHGIGLWDAEQGGQLILRGRILRDPSSLQQPTAFPNVAILFGAGRLKLRLQ